MALPMFTQEEPLENLPEVEESAPRFGEPGFNKGGSNPRKGSPRARITEADARYLAFAGMFPGADAEAFSMLTERLESNLKYPIGGLPTIRGAESRLRKLRKLEAIENFRHAATGITSYGLSKIGIGYARGFGYTLDHGAGINGISLERLTHYRMIAHVAAMFASPAGFFEDSLGIGQVPLERIISEHAMRAAYEPVKVGLQANKKEGKPNDFARWRTEYLNRAIELVGAGRLSWADLVTARPVFLTLGQPKVEGKKAKGVYQPDLAINLDQDRAGSRSNNLLVEIELSRKSFEAYDSILRVIKEETERAHIYSRAVYFTTGSQIETLLKKVDKAGEYGLFASGKLIVLPITHRDGTPVQLNKRITIRGN